MYCDQIHTTNVHTYKSMCPESVCCGGNGGAVPLEIFIKICHTHANNNQSTTVILHRISLRINAQNSTSEENSVHMCSPFC